MHQLLGDEASDFFGALSIRQPVSVRVNPLKKHAYTPENVDRVVWCRYGMYLPERPSFTLDPLFHAGTYYVQEASSMFIEQAVEQLVSEKNGLNILDLCAAPGGKSTHLLSLFPQSSLLVANELIRSRANILSENVAKWGSPNAVVTNSAPGDFGRLPNFFDVILVDAPCSGEGMFRKDPDAVGEWSEANVVLCAERQREILSDIWSSLKEGGLLIYSTCTYNTKENEENAVWLKESFGAQPQRLLLKTEWGVTETETAGCYGYRFFPHKVKGEGFFLAAFRKDGSVPGARTTGSKMAKKTLLSPLPKSFDNIRRLVQLPDEYTFGLFNEKVKALPAEKQIVIEQVERNLRIVSSGLLLGEIKGKDFIPSPSAALSLTLNRNCFPTVEVDSDTAISYLKRQPVTVSSDTPKGFVLVCYNNVPLGWLKNLGSRTNNLYPAEWRIRMS